MDAKQYLRELTFLEGLMIGVSVALASRLTRRQNMIRIVAGAIIANLGSILALNVFERGIPENSPNRTLFKYKCGSIIALSIPVLTFSGALIGSATGSSNGKLIQQLK